MPFPSSRPAQNQPPAQQPAGRPAWGNAAQQRYEAPQPQNQPPAQQPAQQPAGRPAWGGGGAGNAPRTSAPASRSPFAGVETAEVYQRNAFVKEGDYILKVLSVIFKDGRQKDMVIIEADVLVSNYDPQTAPQANHEGTRISLFISAENDSFLSNMKELIIAASGFDKEGNARPLDDMVSATECEDAVGPSQPLAGAMLYTKARQITTRNGNPYTRVSYHPAVLMQDGSPDVQKCVELYGA